MKMTATIPSSAAEVVADPAAFVPAVRELVPDFDYRAAAALADALAEEELLEEMVSYGKNVTGIENIIFISPKGRTGHAARIRLAINPPESFSPLGEIASIAVADGAVLAGQVSPALLREVRRFIAQNRDVLIDDWEYRILTDELQRRLRSI
jgi:hypothetical protein